MKKRFYELDLLRFLAALSVLMFHFTFRGYAADNYSPIEFPVLGEVFKYGYLGVDLFLMISGFVILLSVENKTAKEFVISRIVRLYPAFWICVSLTYFVIILTPQDVFHATFPQYLVNLTMLNKFVGVKSIDGVYWTLALELRFYFWIFVFMFVKQMDKLRYFFLFMLFLSVISLFYDVKLLNNLFFLNFCSYFIAGCVFYAISRHGVNRMYLFILTASYILSLFHSFAVINEIKIRYGANLNPLYVCSIITSFYMVFAILVSGKVKFTNHPILFYLGISTYPLYLLHQNIGYILLNMLNGTMNKYVILVGITLFMISLSFIIWHYGEKPLTKYIKHRFNKRL